MDRKPDRQPERDRRGKDGGDIVGEHRVVFEDEQFLAVFDHGLPGLAVGKVAGNVLPPRRARPVARRPLAFLRRKPGGFDRVEKGERQAESGQLPDLELPPDVLRLSADDQYFQTRSLALRPCRPRANI